MIVDLSGVDFLASMGVRLLLSNGKALGSRGGKMVICKADPMVRKVLETTGTDAIIPLYDDVDSAHQALKARGLVASISLDTQQSCRNALN